MVSGLIIIAFSSALIKFSFRSWSTDRLKMKTYVLLLVLVGLGLSNAQIPGFGGCPDWVSQANFDMNRVRK